MRIIYRLCKKISFIIILALICLLNSVCHVKSYKERATEYVMNHEEEILLMVEQQGEPVLEGAKLRVHKDDWTYAEFVLGGISMGDGSIFGFYYTQEDEPYLYWNSYSELEKVGENSYRAYDRQQYSEDMTEEEKQACNCIEISKICEHIWYWCESY